MMITFEEIEDKPNQPTLEKIKTFCQSIFKEFDLENFAERIDSAEKLLTILAFSGDKLVGFKLGYQIDLTKFYSWLGGVDRDFRKQGIADELMKRQHSWCRNHGFSIIQTKTKNSFKPMLILNIKHGFDIIDLQRNRRDEIKIVLEKNI